MDYYTPGYSHHLLTGTDPLTEKERETLEIIAQATKGSSDIWAIAIHLVEGDGRPEKVRQLFRELKSQLLDEVITMEKIIGRSGICALLNI